MAENFKNYDSDGGDFISIQYEKIIPDNHPARYIKHFIGSVDVTDFESKYKVGIGKRGKSPLDIKMMLCVILFAFHSRIFSARKIDYATEHYSDFWFFTHKNRISHDKISDFINMHKEEISKIFLETIRLAEKNNLISFESLYQDGFFIKANASKSRNYNKKRLETRKKKLEKALNELLDCIGDNHDEVLGNESMRLKGELEKINDLKNELNERIKVRSQKDCPSEIKTREETMTINYTDKDSELNKMKDDSYANAYQKVTAVDPKSDIIVSSSISGHCDEPHKLIPLILEANDNCKGLGEYDKSCADSAFITMGNCVQAEARDIELIGPTKQHENIVRNPEKHKDVTSFEYDEQNDCVKCSNGQILDYHEKYHDYRRGSAVLSYWNKEACKKCSMKDKCTSGEYRVVKIDSRFPAQKRALDRYKSEEGGRLYKKRSHSGEVVQGDLKQNGKYMQLLRRGIEKVKVDSMLHDISWNLRRIFSSCENNLGLLKI